MSYEDAKQLITGKIPSWQRVLRKTQDIGNEANAGLNSFIDSYTFGLAPAAESLADKMVPLSPLAEEKFKSMEPETSGVGKLIGSIAGLFAGPGKVADAGIGVLETGKVQKIQKSFGPWVKGYTNEYGKTFRKGIKEVIKKGDKKELVKEVQRIFNPLRRSDSFIDLPAKTQKAVEKVYSSNTSTRDVLNAANRVRKSGSKLDEVGKLARETSGKLKNIIKKESPEFAKVDREYGPFTGVREVMERFKPSAKGQAEFGTQSGTRILRNIYKEQPGSIEAMKRFGKETNIPIVGPAKAAAVARGIGNVIGKSLPYAVGIGTPGYLIAKRFLGQNNQYDNSNP